MNTVFVLFKRENFLTEAGRYQEYMCPAILGIFDDKFKAMDAGNEYAHTGMNWATEQRTGIHQTHTVLVATNYTKDKHWRMDFEIFEWMVR